METSEVLSSFGYRVKDTLGEGNFGIVKLATSERHPDKVAIKIIKGRVKSKFFDKFVIQELAVLRKVRHPHIVQVHEIFGMPNGEVYIVMEAVATTLFQRIKDLLLISSDQAKTWFSQLLSAVGYLHQQNIAHRDIKCENVLVTSDNEIKLTDFGLARISKGFTDLSWTYCGTPAYSAPEVLLDLPYEPKKADVWSLGVVLYAMITGCIPFRDPSNNWSNLPRLQRKPVKYPQNVIVEEPCRAFISFMLRFNPLARPSVKKVAQHHWLQSRQEQLQHSSNRLESGKTFCSSRVCKLQTKNTDQEEAGPSRAVRSTGCKETPSPDPLSCPPAARVIGRFLVVAVPDQEVERSSWRSHPDIQPQQQIEKECHSSLGSSRVVDRTSSCTYEDGQGRITVQKSIEEEIQSSPLSREGDAVPSQVGCQTLTNEMKGSSSRACVSLACKRGKVVGEECGCFSPLCSMVKRAAKKAVAPILKASRSLSQRVKRLFRDKSVVRNSSSASP